MKIRKLKEMVCTLAALAVMLLTVTGGYAAFFIVQAWTTGIVELDSINRAAAIAATVCVNMVLYGAIFWAVKEG